MQRDDDRPGSLRNRLGRAGAAAVVMGPLLLLLGETGRWWHFGDLASHFRAQFLVFALIAALVLSFTWSEHRRWIVAAWLNVVLHVALLFPWYLSPEADPAGEARIRVMLANVWSSNPEKDAVLAAIREQEPDVLVLLEITQDWQEQLDALAAEMPHGFALPRADNFGIALRSRVPLTDSAPARLFRPDSPAGVMARVTLGPERSFLLVGTHTMPPVRPAAFAERNAEFDRLAAHVREAEGPVVIVGDLNCTMFSPQYRRFRDEAGLRNARQGFGILPSWPLYWPDPMRIPIDHILTTTDLVATRCRVVPLPGSDHAAVVADLGWTTD